MNEIQELENATIINIQENTNNVIVKHQDLVWEARYRLSELGIKIVAVLISMIRIDDDNFHQYKIKIDDFKELIDSDSNNVYKYAHSIINELISKSMKIGDEQFAWISYGKYVKGSNYMILEISPHLKPYLLEIQGKFLKYNIINILPLKSNYIIRLYELFKSKWTEYKKYHPKAKSYTFELKIDWLRQHFMIPDSYQYSSHIKKLIIDKAQKQFKEKTDIQFKYKEQKLIGKKIDRLIITVEDNDKGSNHFLSNIKEFAKALKDFYKGDTEIDIYPTLTSDKKEIVDVKVNSKDQNLYLIYSDKVINLTANQSKAIFNLLFELAKENNITEIDEVSLIQDERIDKLLYDLVGLNKKQNSLFSNDELKSEFADYIGLTFYDNNENKCTIKTITKIQNLDKLKVLVYNDFLTAHQEYYLTKEQLESLK